MNIEDAIIAIMIKYDAIVDFNIEVINSRFLDHNVYGSIGYKWIPTIYKLIIYINEAYYVADRIFHPPIEEHLNVLTSNYCVVKYTIKFVEKLDEEPLKDISSKKKLSKH